MLFNSIEFFIFLPIVFLLYWWIGKTRIRQQNLLLLLASYFFYATWDWRFLTLLLFSTLVDFTVGNKLEFETNLSKRKAWLTVSLLSNLGLLGFFKYYNFFVDSFAHAFTFFGHHIDAKRLHIILPVGISFYTFQTLSYTIDVYKKKIKNTHNLIDFAVFVSFFPQLVAGPIERAKHLLPQFSKERNFNYSQSVDGLRQMMWGLFKKVVIADNCAIYVNHVFGNVVDMNSSALLIGAICFAIQIYGDFSGYSDMAIGMARLFGFDIMQNFAYPYFSRDLAEFWRRWHISLSTWFRDYLYIPLGGSRGKLASQIRNILIVFLVSGFWHGAKWTFIVWGLLHALLFIPLLLTKTNRKHIEIVAKGHVLPNPKELFNMLLTFVITTVAWVFFRAENLQHALMYFNKFDIRTLIENPTIPQKHHFLLLIGFIIGFFMFEWLGREKKHALEHFGRHWRPGFRYVFYYVLFLLIFFYGQSNQEFIYFQF